MAFSWLADAAMRGAKPPATQQDSKRGRGDRSRRPCVKAFKIEQR
jgi:hypothetical protein